MLAAQQSHVATIGRRIAYEEIAAVNFSTLKHLSVSPRMYRHRLAHPEPQKKAYVVGGAFHCMTLEPDAFASRYVVLDPETIERLAPGRGTKEGKELIRAHPEWSTAAMTSDEYQAACVAAAHPGKQALTEKQYAACVGMSEAVRGHRVARDLLRGGIAEEALVWTDPETGLKCKGRVDYLRPDLVIDLKSTRDPSPSKFERAAATYGYAAQVAFYQGGAEITKRVSGGGMPCVIAVRAGDDFDVACFQLAQETFDMGRTICRSLLQRLAECIEADYWPGVAPESRSLNLPPWAVGEVIDSEPTDEEM